MERGPRLSVYNPLPCKVQSQYPIQFILQGFNTRRTICRYKKPLTAAVYHQNRRQTIEANKPQTHRGILDWSAGVRSKPLPERGAVCSTASTKDKFGRKYRVNRKRLNEMSNSFRHNTRSSVILVKRVVYCWGFKEHGDKLNMVWSTQKYCRSIEKVMSCHKWQSTQDRLI